MELKDLSLNEIEYVISIVVEVFGEREMIYNQDDKLCYLTNAIFLPSPKEMSLLAIGLNSEERDEVVLKVRYSNGQEELVNSIEV